MQKQLAVLLPSFDNSKEDHDVIKSIGDCLKKDNISHEFFVCNSSNQNLGYKLNFLYLESLKAGYENFAYHYNENITSSDTFGCVLFNKNQYQTINGVNNDINSKIDLLNNLQNRFKNNSLLESLNLTSRYEKKAIAQFDGESSSITIKPHYDLKNITNKNFSFFFLVKPESEDDRLDKVNSKIPLLSRCGLEFLSYDESGKAFVSIVNTELKIFTLESNILLNNWNMILVNINIEESKLTIVVNGHESTLSIPNDYKMEILHYLRHSIVIGSSCSKTNVSNKKFKGKLALFGMFDTVFNIKNCKEYKDLLTNKPISQNCKVFYGFNKLDQKYAIDQSGKNNNGILKNIYIEEVDIEPVQYHDFPAMEGFWCTSSKKEDGIKKISEITKYNENEIDNKDNKDNINSLTYSIDNIEIINNDIRVYGLKSC